MDFKQEPPIIIERPVESSEYMYVEEYPKALSEEKRIIV